jgi:prepilin-type processing-associated H-X9-DG protein
MNTSHERLEVLSMMTAGVLADRLTICKTRAVRTSAQSQVGQPSQMARGFTRFELLVLLGCLTLLAGLGLPALAGRTTPRSERVVCVNNLRQIGMAWQMWAGDHDNTYPFQLPPTRGGTQGRALAYEHSRVISNELKNVQLLICPSDERTITTNFQSLLRDESVSYFIGTDALPELFTTFLGGDRNISGGGVTTCGQAGSITVNGYPPASWGSMRWRTDIHAGSGNVLMSDGRVEPVSSKALGPLASTTLDAGQDNHSLIPNYRPPG